jgi:hypothetical protein
MYGFNLCIPRNKTVLPVSDLYIPRIGLLILLQPKRQTDPGNLNCSQIHECRNWERGRAVSFLGIHNRIFGTVRFEKSAQFVYDLKEIGRKLSVEIASKYL